MPIEKFSKYGRGGRDLLGFYDPDKQKAAVCEVIENHNLIYVVSCAKEGDEKQPTYLPGRPSVFDIKRILESNATEEEIMNECTSLLQM